MGIGGSDGAYYEDDFDRLTGNDGNKPEEEPSAGSKGSRSPSDVSITFRGTPNPSGSAASGSKRTPLDPNTPGVVNPDLNPNLNTKDWNEWTPNNTPTPLFNRETDTMNVSDIEDRRNESFGSFASSFLHPTWLTDKGRAMLTNPMPGTEAQTYTSQLPGPTDNPLSNALGAQDLRGGADLPPTRIDHTLPDIENVPHHDWVERMIGGIASGIRNGFIEPHKAYEGQSLEDQIRGAVDMTGIVGMSGAPKTGRQDWGALEAQFQKALKDFYAGEVPVQRTVAPTEHTVTVPGQGQAPVHVEIKDPFKQEPFDPDKWYQQVKNEWDSDPHWADAMVDEAAKETPKGKFLQSVAKAHEGFMQDAKKAQQQYKEAVAQPESESFNKATKSAEELGYTQPAFRGLALHGASEPNPIFNFAKVPHMYSTSSPMLADMYSAYLDSHPGINVPPGTFHEGATVMPLVINTKDYHIYDAGGKLWSESGGNQKAIQEARQLGKKGVMIKNVWDEPNSTYALGKPKTIFVTFPEGAGTVKSWFAKKFDESSPNIMHGIGIGVPGGAAGYVTVQQSKASEAK